MSESHTGRVDSPVWYLNPWYYLLLLAVLTTSFVFIGGYQIALTILLIGLCLILCMPIFTPWSRMYPEYSELMSKKIKIVLLISLGIFGVVLWILLKYLKWSENDRKNHPPLKPGVIKAFGDPMSAQLLAQNKQRQHDEQMRIAREQMEKIRQFELATFMAFLNWKNNQNN